MLPDNFECFLSQKMKRCPKTDLNCKWTSPLPLERALHEAGPLDAGALLRPLPAELGLVLQLRDDMTQVKICLDKIS